MNYIATKDKGIKESKNFAVFAGDHDFRTKLIRPTDYLFTKLVELNEATLHEQTENGHTYYHIFREVIKNDEIYYIYIDSKSIY